MTTTTTAQCVICGLTFEARTSYGLCSLCYTKDRIREFDRLESARVRAERCSLPATLTLIQWLSTVSDFRGMCAYCRVVPFSLICLVHPYGGLTYENVVPCCRSCQVHLKHGFETAEKRVAAYLQSDRVPTLQREQDEAEETLGERQIAESAGRSTS